MLSLIQRVTQASVTVDGETIGAIGPGLLALVAVEPGDGEAQYQRLAERLLGYRVFADEAGKMNRSLTDTGGGLLLVSQFTLAADTRSGMRASFTTAAPPGEADRLDKHEKVERDSFSMPAREHKRIKALREALGKEGVLVSKSELLRAGLALLAARDTGEIARLVAALPKVEKGKRKKR